MSTPDSIPGVLPDGQIANPARPGLRVELLRKAGAQCGVQVRFSLAPWARALGLVKAGRVEGAFSTSYSEERSVYGVFPQANGKLDPSRAMKGYTYSLYVHPESTLGWDGKAVSGTERQVIVERGSAASEIAIRLGLDPIEVPGYRNMVLMLAAKRAEGMIGIDTYIDKALEADATLDGRIRALSPPLAAKHGFVMFSRAFYAQHTELAECFWNALREIRAQPAYRELVKSYNNGVFEE